MTDDMEGADVLLQSDEADIVLNIPAGFERDLLRNQVTEVQLRVNAINGSKGTGRFLCRYGYW